MIFLSIPGKKPLGHFVISNLTVCEKCGSPLQVRKDRHSSVNIYEGPIPGAHFHKVCQNVNCRVLLMVTTLLNCVQLWVGISSMLLLFSGHFFSLDILQQADAHVLIGHLSYSKLTFTTIVIHVCHQPLQGNVVEITPTHVQLHLFYVAT